MNIVLNGDNKTITAGATILELVQDLDLAPASMVVEVNQVIIQHQDFSTTELSDGDVVELIRFVGGG